MMTPGVDPVGVAEIAARAGVAEITVRKWIQRHDAFPHPRWKVSGRNAWEWNEVLTWLEATRRLRAEKPAGDAP